MQHIQKLFFIIILFCSQLGGGKAFAQCSFLDTKISSYTCKDLSPKEAVVELSKIYNFKVSYPSDLLNEKRITLALKGGTIKDALNEIIGRYDLEFVCVGENSIVIRKLQFFISGFILDSSSHQPVSDAIVVSSKQWVESDEDGFFHILCKVGQKNLRVYHPGFDTKSVFVERVETEPITIYLKPNSELSIAEVRVYDSLIMVEKAGGLKLNMEEVSKIPSIAGSPGILNSLRFLPSVQSTLEVNGGLVVQGGGRDQNLVLVDGMELYNPMHLFGLFSVFDQSSLQSVGFYKNAFPAQFGGRLSSVLDVKTKVGDFKKWNSKINLNPVMIETVVDGPIKKDKTSTMVAARRSFTDFFPLFYEQIQKQNQLSNFNYFFYDLTANINHKFSDKTFGYFTSYLGGDRGYINGDEKSFSGEEITENQKDVFTQSNVLSTMGIKTWLSNSLNLTVKTGYAGYGFTHQNDYFLKILSDVETYEREAKLSYSSRINDWKTGIYLKAIQDKNNKITLGMENVWHQFVPANSGYYLRENDLINYDTFYQKRNSKALEQRYFFVNDFRQNKISVSAGFHYSAFINEVTYHSLQPRLNVIFDANKKNKIGLNFAKTSQFMLYVPNNHLGIPIDIWIPAGKSIEPMHCYHYSLDYTKLIKKNWVMHTNIYYKNFLQIIEYKNGVADFINEWDKALYRGIGRTKGVEFILRKDIGKWNGWASYSLSKSDRSIKEIKFGQWFPYQYDRRHDFKCVIHYQHNANLSFGTTWSVASGNYLTAPQIHYALTVEGQRYLIEQYTQKNNLKLPVYHRLDIGVHHKKNLGNSLQIISFTIYNVYNQNNVFYVNSVIKSNGKLEFNPISILPVLPSINYALIF
ncbi:MAG: TonB-dependent receptor plug domain-containing protein [Bacteroidia bacterium]